MFKQKKFIKLFLLFATGMSCSLIADDVAIHEVSFGPHPAPWFTGPLITPSGYTVLPKHWDIEPFIFATGNIGSYNSHWNSSRIDTFYSVKIGSNIKCGITRVFEFHFVPIVTYQETKGKDSFNVSDMLVEVEAQLLRPETLSAIPAIKLSLGAELPIGKYEHLNPAKRKRMQRERDVGSPGRGYPL